MPRPCNPETTYSPRAADKVVAVRGTLESEQISNIRRPARGCSRGLSTLARTSCRSFILSSRPVTSARCNLHLYVGRAPPDVAYVGKRDGKIVKKFSRGAQTSPRRSLVPRRRSRETQKQRLERKERK
ncbi:hypothetical protein PUN28_018799 [Cardiocondyla obscurior]|uniref:Uncharacterized protein n=1 Tax=Cardiocondyla obscurior TaxID=286306 RepID=A0AAW2EGG1_9HYME